MSDHDQERLKELLKKMAETQAAKVPGAAWDNDFEQLVAARFEATEVGSDESQLAEMLERIHKVIRVRARAPSHEDSPTSLLIRGKWIGFATAGAVACALWIAFALRQSLPGQIVGTFATVRGTPRVSTIGDGSSDLIAANRTIRLGMRIETAARETVELRFNEGTRVRVAENSIIEIPRVSGSNFASLRRPPLVKLSKGRAWMDVQTLPGLPKFSVQSSMATAEALGTEFGVEVRRLPASKGEEMVLTVFSGRVKFFNQHGEVEVAAWTRSYARSGFAPSLSKPRRQYTFASVDGLLYAIGGAAHGTTSSIADVEAYDPSTDTWTGLAPLPFASQQLAADTIDGIIYAVGGCTAEAPLSTLQAYDPAINAWSLKAPMPTARTGISASAVGGKLYVLGGSQGFVGPDYADLVEVYEPGANAWTRVPPLPTRRFGVGVGAQNGKLYTVGGALPGKKLSEPRAVVGTVEVYDPQSGTWSSRAPMPTPRAWPTIGVIDGMLYAIGGIDKTGWSNTVEAYDPKTNSWKRLAPSPVAFEASNGGSAIEHQGKLYILGRVGDLELRPGEPESGPRFFQGTPGVACFSAQGWTYSDGDGLTNSVERNLYRTDPMIPDTDRDGISDGVEVWLGTDPVNADSDGDGVRDWEDPWPLSSGAAGSRIVEALTDMAERVRKLPLDEFLIRSVNDKTASERREQFANAIIRAARMVELGNRKEAMEWLLLQVNQGDLATDKLDWMANGEKKADIATEMTVLVMLLRPR